MSIHVCNCDHNGKSEFHLRYPGMTRGVAQELAGKINSGALAAPQEVNQQLLEALKELESILHFHSKDAVDGGFDLDKARAAIAAAEGGK